MSLDQTYARLPITDEPVDGYLVAGVTLLALGIVGLLTGLLPLAVCGLAALGAVVLLRLSDRGAHDARRAVAPGAVAPADAAAVRPVG